MRARPLSLALAILLAGCLAPTTPPAGDGPPTPTPPPDPCDDTRTASCVPPATAECVDLGVVVEPDEVAQGKNASVRATLRNTCDHPILIRGTSGCDMEGLRGAIVVNGTSYWLGHGAATAAQVCTDILPGYVMVNANATKTVRWAWNGTVAQSGIEAQYATLPPGAYEVVASISRPAGLPAARADLQVH